MNQYFLSIRNQTCPNANCPFHGLKLQGNVIAHSQKYPRFKCKNCQKTWVLHQPYFHYRLRKNISKVEEVFRLLKQGLTVRKIAEVADINPGTVQRWKKKFKNISTVTNFTF